MASHNNTYMFDTSDAVKYGSADTAAILYNFRYWLNKNLANKTNIHEGRVWTYNSQEALSELFPWLSVPQIKRQIKKLEDAGILIKGNFNSDKFKKVNWYSVNEERFCVEIDQDSSTDPEIIDQTKSYHRQNDIVPSMEQNRPMLQIKNKQILSKSVNNTRARENLSDHEFEQAVMSELLAENLPDKKVRYAKLKIKEYMDRFPESRSIADCWSYTLQAVVHQIGISGEIHLLKKWDEAMTDENQKRYIRQKNAGSLPWEIEKPTDEAESKPIFGGHRVQELPKDFAPDPVYVEFLEQHHNIPASFTMEQLTEFKTYWHETGDKRKAWQNKFKNHVIYQWKKQPGSKQKESFSDHNSSPGRRKIAAMLLQGMINNGSQDYLHDDSKQEELVACAIEMTDLLIQELENAK